MTSAHMRANRNRAKKPLSSRIGKDQQAKCKKRLSDKTMAGERGEILSRVGVTGNA